MAKWIYPIIGFFIGFIAWGESAALMPVSLLIFPAWFCAKNRLSAWATVFLYFAAASRSLPVATSNFYKINLLNGSIDWLIGVTIVSIPFLLMFFNNKRMRLVGLFIALILISIPPFGLACWTNPLSSTGNWWPGGGWVAFCTLFVLIPLLCKWPVLSILPILLGLTIPIKMIQPPNGWQHLNTNFSGSSGQSNVFKPLTAEDFKDELFKQVKTIEMINKGFEEDNNIILLPESSGGTWMSANKAMWNSFLKDRGVVLVSAYITEEKYKNSVVLAVSRENTKVLYRQRQPVPVSMWWPGRENSCLANWFSNPVVLVQGKRVAFFVCYEQFLTWPVIHSLINKPDLICATRSIWWAKGTSMPAIQKNIMASWARLFSLPLLMATNQ